MHSPEETALVPPPATTRPGKQGLYDPANEHDACGFGFVADIQGRKSNAILRNAIEVHIHHLRRKLGSEIIRNVRGVGWMVSKGA